MYYYSLFKNGTHIRKITFEEAKAIPYSEYIIKSFDTAPSGSRYSYFKHEILDDFGKPKNLKIGNFELIDISNDRSGWNYLYNELTFFDIKNSTPFTVQSDGNFIYKFYESVVSFMERLNVLGSYEAYQNTLKIEELTKSLEKAQENIKTKDKEIKELEEEVKNLKESGI